jgi:hypothetical protein
MEELCTALAALVGELKRTLIKRITTDKSSRLMVPK